MVPRRYKHFVPKALKQLAGAERLFQLWSLANVQTGTGAVWHNQPRATQLQNRGAVL
jgi:hypothetical protein